MAALARLAQVVNRAPGDDLAPVTQECIEHVLQRQQPRLPVDQRHHVDAEHLFHLRLREQVVEQDLRHLAALELDHDAHAVFVGLVAQSVRGDTLDQLVAHQIRDALDELRLVNLVGKLGDDDRLAIALADVLGVGARPHVQPPAARLVGEHDFLRAIDETGGREVRSRNDLHELRERDVRIVDERDAGGHDLVQVVRRDVGRHADRDSG